jgi:hypothetical protein
MDSLAKLLFSSVIAAPISERRVALNEIDGFSISTAYTDDQGYETAVSGTDGHWHPVERYGSKEMAAAGHFKWVQLIKDGKRDITVLGYDDIIDPQNITLS